MVLCIEKRGKAKRIRKAAPKKTDEPSKKDQRKQAMEQQKTQQAEAETRRPSIPPPPTINAPQAEEEERRVPTIQSKTNDSTCRSIDHCPFLCSAEEPVYEEEGPRRAKQTAEKTKRLSQSKLDVISENQSSKSNQRDTSSSSNA